jgi:hypothetical protein
VIHHKTLAETVLLRCEIVGVCYAALVKYLQRYLDKHTLGYNHQQGPREKESVHARLRRQSLRSGVPTSALVRALVHRWLDEQDEVGEVARVPGPEHERQPGLFGEEGGL